MEMVDLYELEEEEDAQMIINLLKEFIQKTDSIIAQKILNNWNEEKAKFVKVFPKEYQKVLEKMNKEMLVEDINNKNIESNFNEVDKNSNFHFGGDVGNKVKDIEDIVYDKRSLDKLR